MSPDISVIIPVKDGADVLSPLLESLAAQTLPPNRFEIIVVDNGSRDGTAKLARSLGATVVEDPVANRSRARNTGSAAAAADRLAFIDADCVATPGWLAALLAHRGEEELVAGPVHVTTSDSPGPVERFEALWRFDQASWVQQGWAASANLCVKRSAFEAVGGFDAVYRHIGEDADFCIRALRRGFRLGYCPEAVVAHEAERELGPLLRRSWRHGYSGNQTMYRLGAGYRAWRRPAPLLSADRALALYQIPRAGFTKAEWRAMGRLARMSYAARIAGSSWAEIRRVR